MTVKTEKAIEWKKKVWDNLTFDIMKDYYSINGIEYGEGQEISKAMDEHVEILKNLGYYGRDAETSKFNDNSNRNSEESESVMARMSMIPPDENHMFVKGTEWDVEGSETKGPQMKSRFS